MLATIRYSCTPIRTAKENPPKLTTANGSEDTTVWRFFTKLHIALANHPATLYLGIYPFWVEILSTHTHTQK